MHYRPAVLPLLSCKVGEYSANIQDNYNMAIESLKADFDTLFKDAEDAMYALSMDDTYLERVSALRTAEDNLILRAETTTNTEKTISIAKEIIESECPDVKEYYLSLLDKEEKGDESVEAVGNANVEFYDLQGVKVNTPEAGLTLIKVDTATGKAQKVVIR